MNEKMMKEIGGYLDGFIEEVDPTCEYSISNDKEDPTIKVTINNSLEHVNEHIELMRSILKETTKGVVVKIEIAKV